jgi:hypothetical protein
MDAMAGGRVRFLGRAVGIVVLSVLFCAVGACSGGDDRVPPKEGTGVAPVRPAALQQRTAADDLADFLTAARRADSALRAAEEMIARDVSAGNGPLEVQRSTSTAVRAVDLDAVRKAIPSGLGAHLLGRVLTVHSGLVSRRASMLFFENPSSFDYAEDGEVEGYPAESVVTTYQKGRPAAERFATDLGEVESLARTAPPLRQRTPSSRDAATLAAVLGAVEAQNTCRTVGGGYVITDSPSIRWKRDPEGGRSSSGNTFRATGFDTLSFDIRYRGGRWRVDVEGC